MYLSTNIRLLEPYPPRSLCLPTSIPNSTILSEICRTGGYHITAILDCCHSAGAARRLPKLGPGDRVRRAQDLDALYAIAEMFAAGEKRLG